MTHRVIDAVGQFASEPKLTVPDEKERSQAFDRMDDNGNR